MLNVFVLCMMASTVVSAMLMVRAVQNHHSERAFFMIFLSICAFLYTAGYLLEMTAPTLESALVGVRVQKMGTPFLVVFHYLFIRDIYGERRLKRYEYGLIFALPALNAFAAQAYPLVKLHYTHVEYLHNGLFANSQGFPGPLAHIANAYNFVLVFLSARYVVRQVRKGGKLRRRQSVLLLLSFLLPVSVNLYHNLTYGSLRMDINPFAISMSLGMLLYAVQAQNLLNVVPLARAQVIESMADALIVCDNDQGFLDANRAAKRLFPELMTALPGQEIPTVLRRVNQEESVFQINGQMRFYNVSQTQILKHGKPGGSLILLHDITEKEKQLKLLYGKATYDPLMHIYNRATFFEMAQYMLGSEEAQSCPYALLMLDFDSFKQINDNYGHTCGDTVLESVAVLVKNHFRKGDIVGRYGGEEIVILLENIGADQVIAVAEKLRLIVEGHTISCQDKIIHVTVSIGIAHAPEGAPHSLSGMLEQADTALYRAKNGGKNRICLYGEGR